MTGRAETITTIDLGYDQMFVLDGGRDARVRVLYGATWLTEEGEPGDAVVRAGGEIALHGGRAVLEGIGPTRVQIIEVPGGRLQRWRLRLRRAAVAARRQIERWQLGTPAAEPNA